MFCNLSNCASSELNPWRFILKENHEETNFLFTSLLFKLIFAKICSSQANSEKRTKGKNEMFTKTSSHPYI